MTGTTQIAVRVPKKLMGKVIGSKGATKADIESDYHVKLTIPARDSPSEDVLIEGDADSCEHAKRRILDICEMAPDVTSGARAEAQRLYDEMNKLYEASRNASSRDEKDRLRQQAEAKRAQAEAANKRAAQLIFESKNGGYGDEQMDLHGLQVKEAMEFVRERLVAVDSDLRSGKLPSLTIITGAGHHSDGNKAKIKPEVRQYLQQQGYPFTEDEAGGQFIVSFEGVTPEASGPAAGAGAGAGAASGRPTQQPKPKKEGDESGGPSLGQILLGLCTCLVGTCLFFSKKKAPEEENTQQRQQQQDQQGAEMQQRSVARV